MIRILFLAAIAALSATTAAHASAPPSIEALAADPDVRAPELSPNGVYVAAYSHREEGDTIHLFRADDPFGNSRKIDLQPLHLTDFRWAGDDKLLMTIVAEAKIYGRGKKTDVTRLVILDLKTGQAKFGDTDARGIMAGNILHIDDHGSYAVVSSQNTPYEYPTVKRIDLATG